MEAMERIIAMEELARNASELIFGVRLRGDRYIISRDGKPAAALVPLSMLEGITATSRRVGELMQEISAAVPPLPEADLGEIIEQEIAAVRAENREQKQSGPA